jgi:hypothetical protein
MIAAVPVSSFIPLYSDCGSRHALTLVSLHPPFLSSCEYLPAMVEGLVFKDLLPVPDTDPTTLEGHHQSLHNAPTESHALAVQAKNSSAEHGQGAAQVEHGQEVVNLGWNEPKEHIASPLVGGLSNEDLWLLVRRFNKVSS